MSRVKTNFHTHTTWCDGKDTPEAMVLSAICRGFSVLGFSSHAAMPVDDGCAIATIDRALAYAADVRSVAEKYSDRIEVLLGVEADFIPGQTDPSWVRYAALGLDYMIGSVHYVIADDGARVPVDHAPELLAQGISAHFGGDARRFIRDYYRQQREMVSRYNFDIVGHLDLVRKFNAKHPFFDEAADWYRQELVETADAVAASGKFVEVNTGAISRGWLDDAYPSAAFRDLLRARGVRFVLSSDAHAAEAIDCAFDRFDAAEEYVEGAIRHADCRG